MLIDSDKLKEILNYTLMLCPEKPDKYAMGTRNGIKRCLEFIAEIEQYKIEELKPISKIGELLKEMKKCSNCTIIITQSLANIVCFELDDVLAKEIRKERIERNIHFTYAE